MKKIGMLTIGQTPRTDVLPPLMEIMGPGYEFVEAGALDGLTKRQVDRLGIRDDDYVLATRLSDGEEVKIAKRAIIPLLQGKLTELEAGGVRLTVVMCTGKFPAFKSKGLVVTPSEILRGVLEASLKSGKLAVVYPAIEQIDYLEHEFGRTGVELYGDYYSPYDSSGLEGLCERLREQKPDLVFLNCFGHGRDLKAAVEDATGVPAIQSNAVIAKVLTELA